MKKRLLTIGLFSFLLSACINSNSSSYSFSFSYDGSKYYLNETNLNFTLKEDNTYDVSINNDTLLSVEKVKVLVTPEKYNGLPVTSFSGKGDIDELVITENILEIDCSDLLRDVNELNLNVDIDRFIDNNCLQYYDEKKANIIDYEGGKYLKNKDNSYAILLGLNSDFVGDFITHKDCEMVMNVDYYQYVNSFTLSENVKKIDSFFVTEKVKLDKNNKYYKIKNNSFMSYDSKVIYYYTSTENTWKIPDSIEDIHYLYLMPHVTELDLNNTKIAHLEFALNESIEKVYMPNIKELAIDSLISQKVVLDIPNTLVDFSLNYSYLNDLHLPSSLRNIKINASELSNLVIDEGIEKINEFSFYQTTLNGVLTLPNSIKEIEKCAFYMCDINELKLPNEIEQINYRTFAFSEVDKLDLPGSLKIIDEEAFSYISSINYIEIKDGCEEIRKDAFKNISEEIMIIVPTSIKYINVNAFMENAIIFYKGDSCPSTLASFQNIYLKDEWTYDEQGNPYIIEK